MANRLVPFRQSDLVRAVKGAKAGGMDVGRVEIDPATGKIILVAAGAAAASPQNDLDKWLEKRDARPA